MDFELRFTDKEITAWAGIGLLKRMLDHMRFDTALSIAGLPQPGSNCGYAPEQLITQFMLSVWCGTNRFELPSSTLCAAKSPHFPIKTRTWKRNLNLLWWHFLLI
jgi:hypothetical protein